MIAATAFSLDAVLLSRDKKFINALAVDLPSLKIATL